ncbi:LysR family transcriptional regulator, partial [Cronobacter sakazakii]
VRARHQEQSAAPQRFMSLLNGAAQSPETAADPPQNVR